DGAPMSGAAGGPGGAAMSQLAGDNAGPGEGAQSLSGGESGGPGDGAPMSGAAENEADDDLLVDMDDDDAFFQADLETRDDEGDNSFVQAEEAPEEDPLTDMDDEAFFQAERARLDGEEDTDLVDPDADRPDFGSLSEGDNDEDEDDLAEDDDLEDLDPSESEKKKASGKFLSTPESVDPAYVTAGALAILVLLIGSVLFMARDQLADLWPGIAGVYEALGIDDASVEGLTFSPPQPVRVMQGGVQTLVVTGFVTNLTDTLKTVPSLKLMLVDEDNNVIQETNAPPRSPTINPNSTQPYRIELQRPDERATSLRVGWD
ncbi:MAG: DUF3426 domain-containing protein, partial [Rhodospirillaceae bacterium]